jgi:cyclic 2,3-diphosphoglycerate synthase
MGALTNAVDGSSLSAGPVIVLIDGEHHPSAVRAALEGLQRERPVVGVVFCGGEEKVRREVLDEPASHYGHDVIVGMQPAAALRLLAGRTQARAVVDLADEPVLPTPAKLDLAAVALHLQLDYEAPGVRLHAPRYDRLDFSGQTLSVIGTGKRTGKTSVSGYWARLLREHGHAPAIVSMGRGGPAEPQVALAGTTLEDLLQIAAAGHHAASDYLEDAVLAGVPAVGCRRVGGGLAGAPFESNVCEAATLAVGLGPSAIIFEGSGACVPPIEVDRTLCVVGDRDGMLQPFEAYRLLRTDLALVMSPSERLRVAVAELCPGEAISCALQLEPVEDVPSGSRIALFSTGSTSCAGVDPVVSSANLARRAALEDDLRRAEAERCDVYLTELKAAGVDTVAARAVALGARVIFLRSRPIARECDLDKALLQLADDG